MATRSGGSGRARRPPTALTCAIQWLSGGTYAVPSSSEQEYYDRLNEYPIYKGSSSKSTTC
eukprot:1866781-Pyramimonas_sp.AAC.1